MSTKAILDAVDHAEQVATAILYATRSERDDARRVAYLLAHAYKNDTRPPEWALRAAAGWAR